MKKLIDGPDDLAAQTPSGGPAAFGFSPDPRLLGAGVGA